MRSAVKNSTIEVDIQSCYRTGLDIALSSDIFAAHDSPWIRSSMLCPWFMYVNDLD